MNYVAGAALFLTGVCATAYVVSIHDEIGSPWQAVWATGFFLAMLTSIAFRQRS